MTGIKLEMPGFWAKISISFGHSRVGALKLELLLDLLFLFDWLYSIVLAVSFYIYVCGCWLNKSQYPFYIYIYPPNHTRLLNAGLNHTTPCFRLDNPW